MLQRVVEALIGHDLDALLFLLTHSAEAALHLDDLGDVIGYVDNEHI
jgi:hypothetical protein